MLEHQRAAQPAGHTDQQHTQAGQVQAHGHDGGFGIAQPQQLAGLLMWMPGALGYLVVDIGLARASSVAALKRAGARAYWPDPSPDTT